MSVFSFIAAHVPSAPPRLRKPGNFDFFRSLLGPLLGVESDTSYSICVLVDDATNLAVEVNFLNQVRTVPLTEMAVTGVGRFCKALVELEIPATDAMATYVIKRQASAVSESYSFRVPGAAGSWFLAFASCNGFSSESVRKSCGDPYERWDRLLELHQQQPISLLIMGGDQIYADSIFEGKHAPLNGWSGLSLKKQKAAPVTPTLAARIEKYYEDLYVQRWAPGSPAAESMRTVMASIPSLMMWDDHDIFDGYGSHGDLQHCETVKTLYRAARKTFQVFQLRGSSNTWFNLSEPQSPLSHSLTFRGCVFHLLDNRTERDPNQIMGTQHWERFKQRLFASPLHAPVFITIPVPPVYRRMTGISEKLELIPGRMELDDDVFDHWSAARHEGERMRLLKNLEKLQQNPARTAPTILLSGDVHVGGVGVVENASGPIAHQIISSGIMHPAPGLIAFTGLLAVTDEENQEVQGIRTRLLPPAGMSTPYIRARNFCQVEVRRHAQGECRFRWHVEGSTSVPSYAASFRAG